MARPRGQRYTAEFEKAIRDVARLELRSEEHKRYLDLFVDFGHLEQLQSKSWQLIFGRRGTGKTHLLGALNEQSSKNLADTRILWLYFSAQDFLLSPFGIQTTDRERAVGFFQTFIHRLGRQLTDDVDVILHSPRFLDRLTGQRRRLQDRVEEKVVEILLLVDIGRPVAAYSDITSSSKMTRQREAGSGVDASISVSPGRLPAVSAGGRAGTSSHTQRSDESSIAARPVPRFQEVRERIVELLELLELEHLYILIDEWSVLDPTTSSAIQPEFAELLKRTFGGSGVVTVKIATNRFQTKLSNRGAGTGYRGLEVNADIFDGVNLDRALVGREHLVRFYRKLLLKRLCLANPAIATVYDPDNDLAAEGAVLEIFSNHEAFRELVTGADGIPRRFLDIFVHLAISNEYALDDPWTVGEVHRAIVATSLPTEEEIDIHSEGNQILWGQAREIVSRTHSRILLAQKGDRDDLRRALGELLEKRVIHEVPPDEVPVDIRADYDAYSIDYGTWLDWESAVGLLEREELRAVPLSASTADRFTLDPGRIKRQGHHCVNCEAQFDASARSYVVRGLCPVCFEPADVRPDVDGRSDVAVTQVESRSA